jgi:PPP family 3-phenylpropionic acid transporter
VKRLPEIELESTFALANTRAMYVSFYMAFGAILPFINLYFERMGLSGLEIGIMTAITVSVISLAAPFWGGYADAHNRHRAVFRMALLVSPLAIALLSRADNFLAYIPFVVAYAIFSSPIVPLQDSAALEVAEAHQRTFGALRAWGSLGWSISTILVGILMQRWGVVWMFYIYIIFMLITFVFSLFQPARKHVLQSTMRHGLRILLYQREMLIFLLSIFLLAVTIGAVSSFLSIYLDGIGATESTIGLAFAISSIIEVPVMLYSGKIIRRTGASGPLKVAFSIFMLCWVLLSFIQAPVWALGVQVLRGISYAAFIVGGVTYINERTPEGLSTTAQAIFNTVVFGLGAIVGALLGGYLFDTVGMVTLFRVLTLLALVGLLVFWLVDRSENKPEAQTIDL